MNKFHYFSDFEHARWYVPPAIAGLRITKSTLDSKFEMENNLSALQFYLELENRSLIKIEELIKSGDLESNKIWYLSRAHMVGDAIEVLRANLELLSQFQPGIEQIWISGISVFDTTSLIFLVELSKVVDLRLNILNFTYDRTKSRLESMEIEINQIEEISKITSARSRFRSALAVSFCTSGRSKPATRCLRVGARCKTTTPGQAGTR